MKSIRIRMRNVDQAIELVRIADRFPQKITISSDNFSVNAKSLLGVFSTSFNGIYHLDIHEKDDRKLQDIIVQFASFTVSGSN